MSRLWLLIQTLVILTLASPIAWAQYSSTNYQANEVFFGAGGDPEASSANYKASLSLGALAVGRVSSSNYQAYSGFLTPGDPFLEFGIDSTLVDLGTLDSSSAKTGSALFHVRTYVDSGYTVQTLSQPPKVTSGASHTLTPMSTLAASSTGTEQFGINLVANTSPVTFGADPSPQPDSTFATGQAATGYGTTNQYKYNVGDIIAQTGTSGWGQTNYTISYIANIAPLTPAGKYTMVQDLVVIATY
jgi:hypothetical protein